ncbi:ABC transporter ATP-binding protein [Nakamurella endophytica]|uniref:Iron-dicitrate ABC transporter ATP-binding protein n=1 Tax=Nakamurella endophytica TaxID=1748367 RepID=A0A917SUD8_9ACTN|nr:ABC transporter ATP-binding protein [Nakamurella endophytica]GGL97976.1 iron-dicitrate ABC transporter ATP-binding protein [Nakamurella endophytica]
MSASAVQAREELHGERPAPADGTGPRPPRLAAEGLRVAYGPRVVLDGVDVAVPTGAVTAIIGANASGKSTLLHGLARLRRPVGGRVVLDGRDIFRMPTIEVARAVGLLPQSPTAPDGMTVGDLVARGRYPRQGVLRRWSRADEDAVVRALELTGTLDLADRPVDQLSGGQRQRVWIALTLAQETDILLLDEPTTFLDIAHQIEVLELVRQLHARGTTVAMVLHDLNQAARYADHLLAVRDGRIVAEGPPAQVLTPELVGAVFGLRAHVMADPTSGAPLVVPIGLLPAADRP